MKDNVLIRVEGVTKKFGKTKALDNVSQQISSGEVVVVIGPSGSGKSTFLRCLNLLEEPTEGHIYFEGSDITNPSVNINKLRQKMGMVFQQFNLFPHMTIMKNLTLAPMKLLGKSKAEAIMRAIKAYVPNHLPLRGKVLITEYEAWKNRPMGQLREVQ